MGKMKDALIGSGVEKGLAVGDWTDAPQGMELLARCRTCGRLAREAKTEKRRNRALDMLDSYLQAAMLQAIIPDAYKAEFCARAGQHPTPERVEQVWTEARRFWPQAKREAFASWCRDMADGEAWPGVVLEVLWRQPEFAYLCELTGVEKAKDLKATATDTEPYPSA